MKRASLLAAFALTASLAVPAIAGIMASQNVVENAAASKDHTTLVAAVQAAGLAETLSGAGPFTVFAPTNDAFAKLPAGTVDTLLKPESKDQLTSILTYHVVPGKVMAADVLDAIKKGNGKFEAKTVQGGTLTFTADDSGVTVTDAKGGKSKVTTADIDSSNGVIHVVDSVLMP